MQTFVLQDWVLVQGSNANDLIQTERHWLDLSPFQDLIAWIDVRAATSPSSPTLFLETAPSKDELLFVSMNGSIATPTGYPMVSGNTPLVAQLALGTAATPLATFLRWRIRGPAITWNAAFRIVVAANSPGWMTPSADSPGTVNLPMSPNKSSLPSLGSIIYPPSYELL